MKLRSEGRLLRIGHRGAPALAPENTLASFAAALEHGVDLVELDVVERLGSLRLAHSAGQLTEGSPSLGDALDFIVAEAPCEVGVILDLKSVGVEAEVLGELSERGLLERAVVSSFHPRTLRAARRLEPAVTTGFSYPFDRAGISGRRLLQSLIRPGLAGLRQTLPLRIGGLLARAQADAAMLHHALISARLVERCHRRGAAVLAWTVEDEATLRRVVAAGVDGVIANDPRLFDH